MAVTLHDVARLSGVSIKTVSNVINDYPHIRPETRERVERAIAQLGYSPNLSARNLRRGRTGAIGLALPDLSFPYFAELAAEVMRAADERGLTVLIEQTGADPEVELSVLRSPRRQLTDGLLFSPLGLGHRDVAALAVDFPLVLLGERMFSPDVDHVAMQNVAASRAATTHLLRSGRRRILVLGAHEGEVVGTAALRLEGYRAALADAGLDVDDRLIAYSEPWHRAGGAAAMRRVLADGVSFDAVFALNDTLALGAIRSLQDAGFRVPADVAVVGFDDIDESGFSVPSLTSIDPGRPEIAATAIAVLVARIEGVEVPGPRLHESRFELVVRESSAG